MAARINKTTHAEKTKNLIRGSQLLNRLIAHANDQVDMSATQVQAARIALAKILPDLKATEHSGEVDVNVEGFIFKRPANRG